MSFHQMHFVVLLIVCDSRFTKGTFGDQKCRDQTLGSRVYFVMLNVELCCRWTYGGADISDERASCSCPFSKWHSPSNEQRARYKHKRWVQSVDFPCHSIMEKQYWGHESNIYIYIYKFITVFFFTTNCCSSLGSYTSVVSVVFLLLLLFLTDV